MRGRDVRQQDSFRSLKERHTSLLFPQGTKEGSKNGEHEAQNMVTVPYSIFRNRVGVFPRFPVDIWSSWGWNYFTVPLLLQ